MNKRIIDELVTQTPIIQIIINENQTHAP